MTPRRYEQHVPGDGYGPDVDPVTGDEAETDELPEEGDDGYGCEALS